MRVLFLSASGALGGSERVLLEMMATLRRTAPGWRLGLLAVEPGPLLQEASVLGVETMVEPLPPAFASLGESGRTRARLLAGLAMSTLPLARYRRRLKAALRDWRPDVVHSNALKTHVLAAWSTPAHARLVWHVHDYVSSRPLSRWLLRMHAGRPATIAANSQSVAADVAQVCGRAVSTVYNTVDLDRFTPAGPVADLDQLSGLPDAPRDTVRAGLVATFARWKGHETFLDALAALPDTLPVRGYIVGGPVYQTGRSQYSLAELREAATRRGVSGRVGFVGFLPDTAPAIRALDVVVHASTEPEPFGLVVAEAMACGRAVIVSGAGGALEIVRPGEDAIVCPPGDAAALGRHIQDLARDGARREALGRAARRHARERFSRDRLVGALYELYGLARPAA